MPDRRGGRAAPRLVFAALVVALVASASSSTASPPVARASTGARAPAFDVIVLGASGGITEDDLTAYLVGAHGRGRYLLADAGTIVAGLRVAERKGALDDVTPRPGQGRVGTMLAEGITGVLLSHPHLDHVSGLVIASPDDGRRPLYALPSTVDAVARDLFNNRTWANFLDEGERPLGKYAVRRLEAGRVVVDDRSTLGITALPLSHGGTTSTAFILTTTSGDALAYLGDTGPDVVEGEGRLAALWRALRPLAQGGKLRGLVVEVSYPDGRPDGLLFGHLTPAHLAAELRAFASGTDALRGLPVIVSHVKPHVDASVDVRETIRAQLEGHDAAGARFLHPRQGDRLAL